MHWILALWFGFWRRFYGANKPWFPAAENSTVGYALPMAAVTFLIFPFYALAHWQAVYFAALALAWWGGIRLTDYSSYWAMMNWTDAKGMMIEGVFITAPVGLVLAILAGITQSWGMAGAALACALSGALIAPGYWIGWRLPTVQNPWLMKGTPWGEFVSWALIGSVFILGGIYG